jgi:hypothetical protein
MDTSGDPTDTQRELRELRARAYGPAADIDGDPVALARLAHLERLQRRARSSTEVPQEAPQETGVAAPAENLPAPIDAIDNSTMRAEATRPSATPGDADRRRSRWHRAPTTRGGLVLLAVSAAMTIIALVYCVDWLMTPRSAASLQPTAPPGEGGAAGPDRWIVVSSEDDLFAELIIDQRTLTPYGSFHGVEVWAADDDLGTACLILIEETSQQTLQAVCTPRSGALIADVGAWPYFDDDFAEDLTAGTVLRFQHRGSTVDAFIIEATDAP